MTPTGGAGARSGYSGTPLLRKLGIRPGVRLALIDPPSVLPAELRELPEDVTVLQRARGPLDLIVAFFVQRRRLTQRLPVLRAALRPGGGLWIAWPKRASGLATELSENVVRELGLQAGLVDNKVCAIDDVWSGLRFVYRVRDRPA